MPFPFEKFPHAKKGNKHNKQQISKNKTRL